MNSKRYIWGELDINFVVVVVVVDLPPSFSSQVFFGSMRDIHRTTSPTSLRNWISQKHSHLGNMIRITLAVLIFRVIVKVVGNDDRNWIYSSPTEKISDAILLVYPLHGALAKNAWASYTRWHNFVIALLNILIEPIQLPDKVSSYGLLENHKTANWSLRRGDEEVKKETNIFIFLLAPEESLFSNRWLGKFV